MNSYKVVEKENKYYIFEGEKEYLTPILLPIATSDKGLAESILRKMNEGDQDAVMQYLDKYNTTELTTMILELASTDPYYSDFDLKTYLNDGKEYIEDSHLKLLIDGFSESGSVLLPFILGTFDVYDEYINWQYDPFLCGMAASSGVSITPWDDSLIFTLDPIYDALCEDDEKTAQIAEDFLIEQCKKYNATLLPSSDKERKKFLCLVMGYIDDEDNEEDDDELSEELE